MASARTTAARAPSSRPARTASTTASIFSRRWGPRCCRRATARRRATSAGGYGTVVQIVCKLPDALGGGDGLYASLFYAHLHKTNVPTTWTSVKAGAKIGTVGKTGNASGPKIKPHLHLEGHHPRERGGRARGAPLGARRGRQGRRGPLLRADRGRVPQAREVPDPGAGHPARAARRPVHSAHVRGQAQARPDDARGERAARGAGEVERALQRQGLRRRSRTSLAQSRNKGWQSALRPAASRARTRT
jgi:murein DD-endopeptidase MepM/ murein hydrolase activator NlpD